MNFLIDHNLERYAVILLGKIASDGWLDLIQIRFITFREIELSTDSSDRAVWQIAQDNQMILLTANRNMKGEDSLEQVLREENTPNSLPIVTIGNLDRFRGDPSYRNRCADRIIEILLDIENYIGVGRVEPVYRELVSLLLQPSPTPGEKVSQKNLVQARKALELLQLAELDNFFRDACISAKPAQIDQIDETAAVFYPIILSDRLEVIIALPSQPLLKVLAFGLSESRQGFSPLPNVEAELENIKSEVESRVRGNYGGLPVPLMNP